MSSSLTTALGGLRAHQGWLDVIGNNLANANTPGFKASRALFANLFSRNLRTATAPTGELGGTNPIQVGLGVRLGSVDRRLDQGTLNFTGRTFDLAIVGSGYFALSDGAQQLFTRVGTFGLDANSELVDLRTGYKVLDPAGAPFDIDTNQVVPPEPTTNVKLSGNLPAVVGGPLAQVLQTSSPMVEGTAATLTSTNGAPFAAIPIGEAWTMRIAVNDGPPQDVSIQGTGNPVTGAEVLAAIAAATGDVVAVEEPTGEITLTTEVAGEEASIQIIPGAAGKDLAGLLGMSTTLVTGTEFAATTATDLNDLVANTRDYQVGDVIEIAGTNAGSAAVSGSFVYGVDGTTVDDLVNFMDALVDDSTIEFDPQTQNITATANSTGESSLSLVMIDSGTNQGSTNWAVHSFGIAVPGTGPDTVVTSTQVMDETGIAHILTYTFERQDDASWNLTVSSDDDDVTVSNAVISGVLFDQDGLLLAPLSATTNVSFNGAAQQEIELDFGSLGGVDGITEFGGPSSLLAISQDGFASGTLGSISVNADGSIDGVFTNGKIIQIGEIGLASFSNPSGLEEVGDGYLITTGSSGAAQIGGVSAIGEVVGGALEESNVDQAEEFVRLIQAQRGFQANARVISTVSDLLAEVVNIV